MLHGVIMAGGCGSRFWPLSRKKLPKQLLPITGSNSMIQETFSRLSQLIPAEHICVITNKEQADGIRQHLPQLPQANILAEPFGRNTAACIGLAAAKIAKADPNGTMVILPADSYIGQPDAFVNVLEMACKTAAENEHIVVLGIPPTFPATGYGYIQRGELVAHEGGIKAFDVLAFKEKPDEITAQDFVSSGNYYWNSGSFIWKVPTIMAAFREFMPELYQSILRISNAIGTEDAERIIAEEYAKMESVSIDYGVMESARQVKVVEATYVWDDVGSWKSLENLHDTDKNGNIINGLAELIDTANCTVVSSGEHLVAAVGVEDLIIVHTPDATLVCHKSRAQDVKKIVDKLNEKKMDSYL